MNIRTYLCVLSTAPFMPFHQILFTLAVNLTKDPTRRHHRGAFPSPLILREDLGRKSGEAFAIEPCRRASLVRLQCGSVQLEVASWVQGCRGSAWTWLWCSACPTSAPVEPSYTEEQGGRRVGQWFPSSDRLRQTVSIVSMAFCRPQGTHTVE